MFGGRETEFAKIAKEVKERQGEALDYNAVLLWKLVSVFAAGHDSNARDKELKDLESMIHPLQDMEYREWHRRFVNSFKTYTGTDKENAWNSQYQTLWVEALVDLMKRNGLLPMGMV